jgi:inorganic pyrophosphatase
MQDKQGNQLMVRVEIPRGSNIKYEIVGGKLICDRILHTPMNYIFNYGSFENTLAGDGDPLDVVLLSEASFYPGCYVKCKIIGVLMTKDEKGDDEKIITVPIDSVDPQYASINDISDLPNSTLEQIKFFFKNYKSLEKNKEVTVGDFHGRADAMEILFNCENKFALANHNQSIDRLIFR